MRVTIRAIGKIKGDPLEEALLTYQKRLRWEVSVQEGEIKQKVSPAALQQEEAKWLLAGVPMGAFVIALDERGKGLTSPAFSALLSQKQLEGFPQFVFLMGGADGLRFIASATNLDRGLASFGVPSDRVIELHQN